VASVYDPDPLRLQLTVPEANVAAISQDMLVHFTVTAFGDQAFTGSVKYISPNIRESTRDLVVEAVCPNADFKVKPGMFAVAKIDRGDTPRPVVPKTSVVEDDTGARVFVVAGQQVQERIVQLGESVGDVTAVVQGVKTGENVVVAPDLVVRQEAGHSIRVRDVGTVIDGQEDYDTAAELSGTPTVLLAMRKQSGANTVQVATRVKERLEDLRKQLPSGYSIELVQCRRHDGEADLLGRTSRWPSRSPSRCS
jgi:hypothetical protein